MISLESWLRVHDVSETISRFFRKLVECVLLFIAESVGLRWDELVGLALIVALVLISVLLLWFLLLLRRPLLGLFLLLPRLRLRLLAGLLEGVVVVRWLLAVGGL